MVSDIVPDAWSSTPGAAAATWLARHARAGLRARSSHPEPMPQRDGIALVVWGPSPPPSVAAESARSAAGATATTVQLALVGGTDNVPSLPRAARRAPQCIAVGPTDQDDRRAPCCLAAAQDAILELTGTPLTTFARGERPSPDSVGSVGRAPAAAPFPLS